MKFEFKVTVHYSLWAKCTQLWPLNVKELFISLQPDVWLRWGLDQMIAFSMDKGFIWKNQNWILPTFDSFPLIVSYITTKCYIYCRLLSTVDSIYLSSDIYLIHIFLFIDRFKSHMIKKQLKFGITSIFLHINSFHSIRPSSAVYCR